MTTQFSPQQTAFLKWVDTGTGSCVLEAVAGAGKTTTLLEAARILVAKGQRVAILAYNKKIADEIKGKTAGMSNVFVGTVHSFGFSALRYRFKNVKLDKWKVHNICDQLGETDQIVKAYKDNIIDLVSYAKQRALGVIGRIEDNAAWLDMIEHFDVFADLEKDGYTSKDIPTEDIIKASKKVLVESNKITDVINYDDMVYLPLILRVPFFKNDVVMVDEAQDTNASRRALVRCIVKPNGRVIAVGDRHQAIYGFCHPAGEMVKTARGHQFIEDIKVGDPVIGSTATGELCGFQGNYKVTEKHEFYHSGMMIALNVDGRAVKVTPHHRVPVRIDSTTQYYTYMMRRDGVYRVGYCQAYTNCGDFMLTHRMKTEKADDAWLLTSFDNKQDAMDAEAYLLQRIKGTSFNNLDGDISTEFETEEREAILILSEHGRMVDFPLITKKYSPRIARNGSFVTEACNVLDGMSMAFYDAKQAEGGKHGQRQSFVWTPVEVSRYHFSGKVYGITLDKKVGRSRNETLPLYFAGDDILVHNTGADSNSLDLIRKDFSAIDMPLTTTFRCPKAVVAYAQKWVSHIQAAETAPEGSVSSIQYSDLYGRNDLNGQSAVLCRNTKPLVELAFSLIRRRVGCKVEGRDIGQGLIKLATKWKIKTTDKLVEKLDLYMEAQKTKFLAKKQEERAQALEDQIETIKIVIEDCNKRGNHSVDCVVESIKAIFEDDVQDKGILTLSTIHKSKGREWRTVYWLDRLGTLPSKYARQEWQKEQEKNLCYVCATRAKESLVEVIVPPKAKK